MKPQFIISSIGQGNGKTITALAITRLLLHRGIKVKLYKCGPDAADTQLHALAGEDCSYNLDTWLASRNHVKYVYNTGAEMADVCIIEGNGGLYDGYKRLQGSTAEMAYIMNVPVVLVVSARQATYSLLPTLYGFKNFRRNVRIAGVIFNHVSSSSQLNFLKDICREAGLECFGHLPYDESLKYQPHQVIQTNENRKLLNEIADSAMAYAEQYIDVDSLLNVTNSIFPCPYSLPYTSEVEQDINHLFYRSDLKISVANDAAFSLPYQENIDCLRKRGKITFFSPVNSRCIPESDIIYFPDGYAEQFARIIHRRRSILSQIKDFADSGGLVLAEGSGLLPLVKSVVTRSGGTTYDMAGVLPFDVTLADSRLQIGLRKIEEEKLKVKGYECRTFSVVRQSDFKGIPAVNHRGVPADSFVYRYKNVYASSFRWYFGESDFPFFD